MSRLRVALVAFAIAILAPSSPGMLCMGAQHAIVLAAAQEHKTPDGEWCQRAPAQSPKAHACACHATTCSDPDPDHLPAHVDVNCLNYCTVAQCLCPKADCP